MSCTEYSDYRQIFDTAVLELYGNLVAPSHRLVLFLGDWREAAITCSGQLSAEGAIASALIVNDNVACHCACRLVRGVLAAFSLAHPATSGAILPHGLT